MRILALELSSAQGSIARLDGEETCFLSEFANARKHSGLFFANLQRCMEQFEKPERIVVGLGPGSYAGTRIAIAAAVGLQAATSAELLGLPSLCAMPTTAMEYAAIGDARRQSFWFALVRARRCIDGPMLCTAQELNEQLDAIKSPIFSAEPLAGFPRALLLHPSALVLAQFAAVVSEEVVRPPLEPIYLREPHITRPKAA